MVAVFSAHTTKIDPTRRNAYVLRLALVRTDPQCTHLSPTLRLAHSESNCVLVRQRSQRW